MLLLFKCNCLKLQLEITVIDTKTKAYHILPAQCELNKNEHPSSYLDASSILDRVIFLNG